MKGQDIEDRLVLFGIRIVNLCDSLSESRARNHIAAQLLRSGTAPAAHYAEARNAESNKDFVHKMRLALKELNESRIWLLILMGSNLVPADKLQPLHQECEALCRIFGASVATAKGRGTTKK
ncbi:MAG: four helix bundle protein [Anaerolineales bacterium]|nr:four helix bundle protein [Anaerolineales bacterium]